MRWLCFRENTPKEFSRDKCLLSQFPTINILVAHKILATYPLDEIPSKSLLELTNCVTQVPVQFLEVSISNALHNQIILKLCHIARTFITSFTRMMCHLKWVSNIKLVHIRSSFMTCLEPSLLAKWQQFWRHLLWRQFFYNRNSFCSLNCTGGDGGRISFVLRTPPLFNHGQGRINMAIDRLHTTNFATVPILEAPAAISSLYLDLGTVHMAMWLQYVLDYIELYCSCCHYKFLNPWKSTNAVFVKHVYSHIL